MLSAPVFLAFIGLLLIYWAVRPPGVNEQTFLHILDLRKRVKELEAQQKNTPKWEFIHKGKLKPASGADEYVPACKIKTQTTPPPTS